jgi:hypothetical protein
MNCFSEHFSDERFCFSLAVLFPAKSIDQSMISLGGASTFNELNYGFVYIAHPRAITHLSWRKTSKYMPK